MKVKTLLSGALLSCAIASSSCMEGELVSFSTNTEVYTIPGGDTDTIFFPANWYITDKNIYCTVEGDSKATYINCEKWKVRVMANRSVLEIKSKETDQKSIFCVTGKYQYNIEGRITHETNEQ